MPGGPFKGTAQIAFPNLQDEADRTEQMGLREFGRVHGNMVEVAGGNSGRPGEEWARAMAASS